MTGGRLQELNWGARAGAMAMRFELQVSNTVAVAEYCGTHTWSE